MSDERQPAPKYDIDEAEAEFRKALEKVDSRRNHDARQRSGAELIEAVCKAAKLVGFDIEADPNGPTWTIIAGPMAVKLTADPRRIRMRAMGISSHDWKELDDPGLIYDFDRARWVEKPPANGAPARSAVIVLAEHVAAVLVPRRDGT